MKICPYCTEENRDDARVCYYCGRDLATAPLRPAPPGNANRTQPVRVRPDLPVRADRTQPFQPPSGTQPGMPPADPYAYPSQPARPTASPPPPQPVYYPPPPPPSSAYPQVPAEKTSRVGPWLIAALVLVFLCAGGLAVYTLTSATGGGLTQLFAPLFSPLPTATPVPPTATPEPTAVPTQSGTLERFLTPECAGALDRLEQLSGQITSNPAAPLDAAWRDNLTAAVAEMRTSCGSLQSASPVPGLVDEAQRNLDLANQEFDMANQLFKDGIDNFKPAQILEAGGHVQQAVKYLNTAITELRKIGN